MSDVLFIGSNLSQVPTPAGSDQRTDTPGSHASFPDHAAHTPPPTGDVPNGALSGDEQENHHGGSDTASAAGSPDPTNLLQVESVNIL